MSMSLSFTGLSTSGTEPGVTHNWCPSGAFHPHRIFDTMMVSGRTGALFSVLCILIFGKNQGCAENSISAHPYKKLWISGNN